MDAALRLGDLAVPRKRSSCACGGRLIARAATQLMGIGFHWRGAEAGSRPAAGHSLLLRQKRLTREKPFDRLRTIGNSRLPESPSGHAAVLTKAGSAGNSPSAQTACSPDPLLLRFSLSSTRGKRERGQPLLRRVTGRRFAWPPIEQASAPVFAAERSDGPWPRSWLSPLLGPVSARARNGAKADQGRRCLSRRRVPPDPAFASTAAVPEGPRVSGISDRPEPVEGLFLLTSFGEAKEVSRLPRDKRPTACATTKKTATSRAHPNKPKQPKRHPQCSKKS